VHHGIELGTVTMRTLPVVPDDAGAECDAKRLIPTHHVRMPWRALTGSVNGGENDCRKWEIWLRRKLDEARGLSIESIFVGTIKVGGTVLLLRTSNSRFFHQHEHLKLLKNS